MTVSRNSKSFLVNEVSWGARCNKPGVSGPSALLRVLDSATEFDLVWFAK